MGKIKAISPEYGYKYQILTRYKGGVWEHCDYAKDELSRDSYVYEYGLDYGKDFLFKVITQPKEFWK